MCIDQNNVNMTEFRKLLLNRKNNFLKFLSLNEMDGKFLFLFIIYVISNGYYWLLEWAWVEHRFYPNFKIFTKEEIKKKSDVILIPKVLAGLPIALRVLKKKER